LFACVKKERVKLRFVSGKKEGERIGGREGRGKEEEMRERGTEKSRQVQ